MEHLAQVKLIAQRIHEQLPWSVALDDLISAGVVGLVAAIDRYDSSRDIKLESYVRFKIRGSILNGLRNLDLAQGQPPKRAKLIETAISALEQERMGSPKGTESEKNGRDLLRYLEDSHERGPSNLEERAELERTVTETMQTMPQLERTVLSLYYHEELTLREIARIAGLSESRISRVKSRAIIRLRSYLSENRKESTASREPTEAELGQYVRSMIEDPVVQILMAAAAAFQKLETGRSWLLTPSLALGNVAPVSLISTRAGREIVANELGLIEHGMF